MSANKIGRRNGTKVPSVITGLFATFSFRQTAENEHAHFEKQ